MKTEMIESENTIHRKDVDEYLEVLYISKATNNGMRHIIYLCIVRWKTK